MVSIHEHEDGVEVSSSGYRPEIDGLRAIAVVAVVLFHMDLGLTGGFVGVDVFFVISGFLISRIICNDLQDGTFSFSTFWVRRIRRIVPALTVVVASSLVVGYLLLLPGELEELAKSSLAQSLLLSNFYFWQDTGYFAEPAHSKPLLHTWSLAVEEQFYLLFPFALWLLRSAGRKTIFGVLFIVAATSLAWSAYATATQPAATFYLLPARTWELLTGCLLAVCPWKFKSSHLRDNLIAVAGLSAIVYAIVEFDAQTPIPGIAATLPVFGTASILFASESTPGIGVGRILSWQPLVFIGLVSYSLYLWHWPVIVYTRFYWEDSGWQQPVYATLLSIIFSYLSWKYVESPVRRSVTLTPRGLVLAAAAATGSIAVISTILVLSNGVVGRANKFDEQLADVTWLGSEFESQPRYKRPLESSDFPLLGSDAAVGEARPHFFVWGDSHGMVLGGAVNDVAKELGLTGRSFLHRGFIPLPFIQRRDKPDRIERRKEIIRHLNKTRPRNLILICRWANYVQHDSPYSLFDPRSDSNETESATEIFQRNFDELIDFCQRRAMTLWVIKQVPETGEAFAAKEYLQFVMGMKTGLSNRRKSRVDHYAQQAAIEHIFGTLPEGSVSFVDLSPMLFDEVGYTINYSSGRAVYRDEDHLTRWGVGRVQPVLKQMFRTIAESIPR